MRSRVIPGSFVTIDRREAVSRLKIVDLPTLGRPTITTEGSFSVIFSVAGDTTNPKREARRRLVYPTGRGNRSVASADRTGYRGLLTDAEEFDGPADLIDDEDEQTLAAIDEGIRDAQTGRTTPIEEVRKLLREWAAPKCQRLI